MTSVVLGLGIGAIFFLAYVQFLRVERKRQARKLDGAIKQLFEGVVRSLNEQAEILKKLNDRADKAVEDLIKLLEKETEPPEFNGGENPLSPPLNHADNDP